jgi:hypothetical protein
MNDYDDNEELEEQEEIDDQDYGEVEQEVFQNDKYNKFAEIAKQDNKIKVKAVNNAHHDFEVDPNQSLEESKDDREKMSKDVTKKGVTQY